MTQQIYFALMVMVSTLSLLPRASAAASDQVREILDTSGCKGGLVVHLGSGDGQLTVALQADGCFRVHGYDADRGNVDRARAFVQSKGLGERVHIRQWTGRQLPYADNMVNMVVLEDEKYATTDEIMRALVPGGALCGKDKTTGKWTSMKKPWPKEIDQWTHWLHSASGNAVSKDTQAGPPRRLQWLAGPTWSRDHNTVPSVTSMVSAGGRLFSIVDEAPASMDGSAPDKWVLVARDAFNGLPLWRRPMPEWGWKAWSAEWMVRFTVPTHITRRLVAVGERVYVTLGFNEPLTELDAATGRTLRTFAGTDWTDEILYHNGQLIVALNKAAQHPGKPVDRRRGEASDPPVRKSVAVVDVASGKILWNKGDYVGLRSKTGSMERISHLSMCVGDGRIFFVDGQEIICLSLDDGRELWRVARPEIPEHPMRYNIRLSDMCSLVYQQGVLYFAQLNPDKRVGWRGVRGRVHAFSASDGKERWNRECASWGWGHPADVFVIDGLVWVHDFKTSFILGLDSQTGEISRKVSNFKAFDNGHHHRCYRNKATTEFFMTSYRGLEFIDVDDGATDLNHWVRGTCRLGAMPCNGLVYATPHPCRCYVSSKINGFAALAPQGKSPTATDRHPLKKGPAYKKSLKNASVTGPEDWPMYRRNPARGGTSTYSMKADFKQVWKTDLGARPTSCVVVGDTVLVALPERHQIVALGNEAGRPRWTFTAGGRIDSPPTIDGGLAFFGAADGWLYCLRLSDGQLAWKFRGAPRERLVGSLDAIESAWPIHGSPIVRDNVVYFTAGRSSFLDGGITAFALDTKSGTVISRRKIATPHTVEVDAGTTEDKDSGLLSDLLVGSGNSIYMRQRRLFPPIEDESPIGPVKPPEKEFLRSTGGLLDDSWFSRERWHLGSRPIAEYMVFNEDSIFGVRAREKMSGYTGFFTPGKAGYELFAADMAPPPPRLDGKGKPRSAKASKVIAKRWSVRVPVRMNALVLAGKTLFGAGTPDKIDPSDIWAYYEGNRGGKLLAFSAKDGSLVAEHQLDAPPVLDGLIVARGRLYLVLTNGNIACYSDGS